MPAPRLDTAPVRTDVNTDRWIAFLESQKDGLAPAQAALVDVFIEHLRAEQAADVERFLAHQTDKPVYRRFGAVEWHLAPDVREWFGRMAAGEFPVYEMETERFIVGTDLIVTDGVLKMATSGAKLLAHNMTLPDGGTKQDTYLVYRRFAIFIPFENGKMAGEDTYRDPPSIVKLEV
jgi:hypothetical protein